MRINAKKYIELTCKTCRHQIQKELKEYTRQTKKGNFDFYCDLKCSGQQHVSTPDAPFNFLIRSCKKSAKQRCYEFNISAEYLQTLWEKQNHKCAYTGIEMILPTYKYIVSPRKASLDRIDSSKGYVEGNVEFVCVFINLGKNGFNKQEIINLLQEFKIS